MKFEGIEYEKFVDPQDRPSQLWRRTSDDKLGFFLNTEFMTIDEKASGIER